MSSEKKKRDFAVDPAGVKRVCDGESLAIKAKAAPKRYSLKELLKQITPESLHDEVDTGPSVGAEDW